MLIVHLYFHFTMLTQPRKAKIQYLRTFNVSIYCLLALCGCTRQRTLSILVKAKIIPQLADKDVYHVCVVCIVSGRAVITNILMGVRIHILFHQINSKFSGRWIVKNNKFIYF